MNDITEREEERFDTGMFKGMMYYDIIEREKDRFDTGMF